MMAYYRSLTFNSRWKFNDIFKTARRTHPWPNTIISPVSLASLPCMKTRFLSTSSQCSLGIWMVRNFEQQPEPLSPFLIVLPNIPDETSENNLMLESIEFNHGWPPLSSGTPEEFYQGTVKLLLEFSTTCAEKIDLLEEELKKKDSLITFEKIFSRIHEDQYNVEYAVGTLLLKMFTDWPECDALDWEKDRSAISELFTDEVINRLTDQVLADAVRSIPQKEITKLGPWEKRYVEFLKAEYKLAGYEPEASTNMKHFKQQEMSTYLQNCDIYKHCYLFILGIYSDPQTSKVVVTIRDRDQLKNAPPKVLRLLADRNDPEEGPWTAKTIDGTIFELLKYSSAREQKQKLWEAWISKASITTEEHLVNNSPIIHLLRHYYQKLAEHLGFRSFPYLQLSSKMIGNPETLREFIASLYHRFRPVFLRRFEDWKNYAEDHEGIPFGQLRPFDMFYICRKEAEYHHGVNTLDLMKYFPAWSTFENMLTAVRSYMGIEFKDITGDTSLERCHPSVRIYKVTDLNGNQHLGRLYVDPFSRQGKISNRWINRVWRLANEERGLDKLVWLVGNMDETNPDTDGPGLLHYEEISEMLEAFGYVLHQLLSQSPFYITTLPYKTTFSHEYDVLGFMPTFMRVFMNKPNLLLSLSSPHVETGEMMSTQMAQNAALMLARGAFWDTWRTLFWSDFDLTLYECENVEDKHYLDLYKEMYQEYFPFPREPNNYQPCSFTPIFVHRTSPCTYYERLWCETLALDVHQTFEKEVDFMLTAARLKETWLKNGPLKPCWEMYKDFQGREPNILAIGNFYDPPSMATLEEGKNRAIAQIF